MIAAQALVPSPAAAAGAQTQVVLSVHQPRVILVRRFMNNVLYVLGLVSHEVDAAGHAQEQQQQHHIQPLPASVPAPSGQASSSSSGVPSAVFLLTLTGVQVCWLCWDSESGSSA